MTAPSSTSAASNYIDQLPKNWALEATKSFGIAFAVGTIIHGDPVKGLVAGSLSATASLIHSGIAPLFKMSVENRHILTWHEELLRACISYAAAGSIGYMFGCTEVLASLFFQTFFQSIIINRYSRDLDHARWLVLFP